MEKGLPLVLAEKSDERPASEAKALTAAFVQAMQVVEEALERQKSTQVETPRRLGEVLVEIGRGTPAQLEQLLQVQHGNRRRLVEAEAVLGRVCPPRGQPPAAGAVYDEIAIDGRKFARMGVHWSISWQRCLHRKQRRPPCWRN